MLKFLQTAFKTLLISLSIITWAPNAFAQETETIQYPYASNFYTYFKNRIQEIQKHLLDKCRDSTLSSYTSGEFLTTMSKKQVDMSGADFYLTTDSFEYTPIKYTDLKGIVFAHQFDTDINNTYVEGHIKGIAIMTDDAFISDQKYWHPVVWIKWDELRTKTTPRDYQFLLKLYQLSVRIAPINPLNFNSIDFEDLIFKNTLYYGTDSVFLTYCSNILNNGKYFINNIRYKDFVQAKDSFVHHAIIYSEASKDSVALYKVGLEQFKNKDSTFVLFNGHISEAQQICFDINTHKLLAFKAHTDADHNQDYGFNIPANIYYRIRFGKEIIWFLEDYYTWLNPNYLNTPIQKK